MEIKTNRKFNYKAIVGEGNPLLRFPLLYEAAADAFSHKKYEHASLNEILKNAGMSKSSLAHHFGDKFGLFLAMIDIIAQKKFAYFTPMMREFNPEGNFFENLRVISRATMAFMLEEERIYHMSNRILEADSALLAKLLEYITYDFSGGLGPLIQLAIDRGQIDGRYSAAFLTGFIEVLFTNMHKISPAGNPDEAFDMMLQVFDILEHGCATKEI